MVKFLLSTGKPLSLSLSELQTVSFVVYWQPVLHSYTSTPSSPNPDHDWC